MPIQTNIATIFASRFISSASSVTVAGSTPPIVSSTSASLGVYSCTSVISSAQTAPSLFTSSHLTETLYSTHSSGSSPVRHSTASSSGSPMFSRSSWVSTLSSSSVSFVCSTLSASSTKSLSSTLKILPTNRSSISATPTSSLLHSMSSPSPAKSPQSPVSAVSTAATSSGTPGSSVQPSSSSSVKLPEVTTSIPSPFSITSFTSGPHVTASSIPPSSSPSLAHPVTSPTLTSPPSSPDHSFTSSPVSSIFVSPSTTHSMSLPSSTVTSSHDHLSSSGSYLVSSSYVLSSSSLEASQIESISSAEPSQSSLSMSGAIPSSAILSSISGSTISSSMLSATSGSASPGITLSAPPSLTIGITGPPSISTSLTLSASTSTLPNSETFLEDESQRNTSLGMLAIASSISTLSSRVFITTTDGQGLTITTAPRLITETLTSTKPDGSVVTNTQIYSNPTLSPDSGTKGNSFFKNVGAVVGVFLLAGLVVASIVLWIIFAIRRRRRTRRLEQDTAISASLAAAGLYRTPLDDDDDDHENNTMVDPRHSGHGFADLYQVRSVTSLPSGAYHDDRSLTSETGELVLNPFEDVEYIVPAGTREGYVSGNGLTFGGTATSIYSQESGVHGNSEPLMASYRRTSLLNPASPGLPSAATSSGLIGGDVCLPPSPRMNPLGDPSVYLPSLGHGLVHRSNYHDATGEPSMEVNAPSDPSVYTPDNVSLDNRLDPGLRLRLQHTTSSKSDLRDEVDYSRPIFDVRNILD